jgi:hypothetical protein
MLHRSSRKLGSQRRGVQGLLDPGRQSISQVNPLLSVSLDQGISGLLFILAENILALAE